EDQDNFAPTETGYKVLKNDLRDYQTGQWSPNFDILGFAADFNTVIPLDRLDELARRGTIGKVSDVHLSYSGAQYDLSAVRMDSGPAGAKLLKDAGVDVVLLTPV
ncbi:glycine/betaine/sarcosine/D-proline family reductase selenoprotein B, partial [Gammaproteobacteria bacterium]|nr:glycine/betaine/sarcosine/D-proline family reductase selenoprotein B [Gammaproteobacteria bacterium]